MRFTKVFSFLTISLYLIITNTAYSQGIGLNMGKQPGGLKPGNDPSVPFGNLVKNTITIFFTVGALGFIIMFLWGAVNWILSGGDKEKIAGARKRITTAIVGLVLLSLTFVVMIVVGQILGLKALYEFDFQIPGLLDK